MSSAAVSDVSVNPTEMLRLLRDFVGDSRYSETILLDVLRHVSYDVQRAAELLLTGQYRPKSSLNVKPAARKSTGGAVSTTATASSRATPANYPSSTSTHLFPNRSADNTNNNGDDDEVQWVPTSSVQLQPTRKRLWVGGSTRKIAKISTSMTAAATPTPTTTTYTSRTSDISYDNSWLLTERWISECVCTSRQGRIRHQEVLTLSHSGKGAPFIRFKGDAVEGMFPTNMAAMLVPLMRFHEESSNEQQSPLVVLRAESLVEDMNIQSGQTIPFRLQIYLESPRAFFELFTKEQAAAAAAAQDATARNTYFDMKSNKNKNRSPIVEAAFGLLQFAEYGDVPIFQVPVSEAAKKNAQDDGADEDEDDDSGDRKMAATDKEAQELDNTVAPDKTLELPEIDDPPGLTPGVTLRSYQRQALYWMRKRETQGYSRTEQEEQIQLLQELAVAESRTNGQSQTCSSGKENRGDIHCEAGPVIVSEQGRKRSRTLDGQVDPVSHPLWKQRFLSSADMTETVTFYVNEVLGVATHQPPEPPKSCSGGILADEMGLGKTVIVLAVILQEKAERMAQVDHPTVETPTTTLVIVKLSLLNQWKEEIETKTNLSVFVYYGPAARTARVEDLAAADIVLTTYECLPGEIKRKQPTLLQFPWLRVVLDEAHSIKNQATMVSKATCNLDAVHRWACTGTVVQNGLDDVYGIMKFLRHEPWCWSSFWNVAVSKPWVAGREEKTEEACEAATKENVAKVLVRVRKLLSPLMIRRTKDILNLNLPPVDTQVVKVDFTTAERQFYDAVLKRSGEIFDDYMDKGTGEKSYIVFFRMITLLRQICDHISLTVRSKIDNSEQIIDDGMAEAEGNTKVGNSSVADALGGRFLEDLLSKFQQMASPSKKTYGSVDDAYLSNMARRLTASIAQNSTHIQDECPICLEQPLIEKAAISPCGHIFCKACLVGYLREKEAPSNEPKEGFLKAKPADGECPCCNKVIETRKIVELTKSETTEGISYSANFFSVRAKHPITVKKEGPETTLENHQSAAARRILEEAVGGMESSSKLSAVMDELKVISDADPGSKTLIFSHYLGFLDMLQDKLQAEGVLFYRLDGSLSLKERIRVLEEFKSCQNDDDGKSVRGAVLLLSITAGAEGLNLTVASNCFIIEPWWNSAKEDQCINRIHRIGQTAPLVRVRQFIVNNSVEEQILKMQSYKKGIADELYNDSGDGELSGSKLSLNDMKLIFHGGE